MLGWIHQGLQSLITATPLRIGTWPVPKAVLSSTLYPLTAAKVNIFLLVLRWRSVAYTEVVLVLPSLLGQPLKITLEEKERPIMKSTNCKPFAGRKRMTDAGIEGSRGCRNQQKYGASNVKCHSGRVKIKGYVEGTSTVTGCTFI